MSPLAAGLALSLVLALPLAAQDRPALRIRGPGFERMVTLVADRGYAALRASDLSLLGWRVLPASGGSVLEGPGGVRVQVRDRNPFFRWDHTLLQLTEPPFSEGGVAYVPLQFVTDFLPSRMPNRYRFDGPAMRLTVAYAAEDTASVVPPRDTAGAPGGPGPSSEVPRGSGSQASAKLPVKLHRPPPIDDKRVVIIDAGHGGADPGSISHSGIREKTVALGVARAVAEALRGTPGLEVHLIRKDDSFVPLWDRGPLANRMKGERPGVFVSIHANSFRSDARGFETYFLSPARTEHERRVAAIENAPLSAEDRGVVQGGDLDHILKELKNLDTQHWSSLLAEMVQGEIAKIHPGPNRGVKQAPLAVITNAVMPSVLVEVGYLSNRKEASLLAKRDFQRKVGRAIASAIKEFFQRYPPGSGNGAGEHR